jgi:hypothetical protein
MWRSFVATIVVVSGVAAGAQQVPDTSFTPPISDPAFASGQGPRLAIDDGHHNFHTSTGRYRPFAMLAARDGYRVAGTPGPFTDSLLAGIDVLVIANALAERNEGGRWTLPTPSAFTPDEIAAVVRWLQRGGSLLLIADHMPFGGAAESLATAVGVRWANAFALDSASRGGNFVLHRGAELAPHAVFEGRASGERIDSIVVFTGSALGLAGAGSPLFGLPPHVTLLYPTEAWRFSRDTRRESGAGWLQGAALRVGRGRVVALGEAAMMSAQRQGPRGNPMGFNDPRAAQNVQFILNVLHWLSGLLPEPSPR